MARNKNEKANANKPLYKKWWFWTILILLMSGILGSANSTDSKSPKTPETIETVPQFTSELTDNKDIDIETEGEEQNYADDVIVNKFISEYNSISESDFTEIKRGNIRTKYFAYSHGYYCELLNSNTTGTTGKICVTIDETNDNADAGVSGMRNIFRDVIKTIDSSVDDEEIYKCFDSAISDGYLKSGILLGNAIITICPDIELSNGHSRGHIEIVAN